MLRQLAKAVFIAVLAALASGLPMAALLTLDMDPGLRIVHAAKLFLVALAGSVMIGLPMSLLTFCLVMRNHSFGVWKLILIGNLAAICLALSAGVAAGVFGLLFYGLPIIIAANVFAVAGWFVIVKPTRAEIWDNQYA